jgi:V8-like Glu-specific endopeptidase
VKNPAKISLFILSFFLFSCGQENNHSKLELKSGKAVYGKDDRVSVSESKSCVKTLGKSVAAMVIEDDLDFSDPDKVIAKIESLEKKQNLCADERFAKLPALAYCTGFLVGENLLVTAGHCISSQIMCDIAYWVFDYDQEKEVVGKTMEFKKDQVYRCKKIISRDNDPLVGNDYALIELERKVVDRAPLKFRKKNKIADQSTLFALSFPSGLGLTYIPNAKIRDNEQDFFFVTNLDTFHNSSGSPVFNQRTRAVEGLLVRGATDYIYDEEKECNRLNRCDELLSKEDCEGESVVRITVIPELAPGMTPQKPILDLAP